MGCSVHASLAGTHQPPCSQGREHTAQPAGNASSEKFESIQQCMQCHLGACANSTLAMTLHTTTAACRYNLVNKRLPGWQDPPTRDAIQVSRTGSSKLCWPAQRKLPSHPPASVRSVTHAGRTITLASTEPGVQSVWQQPESSVAAQHVVAAGSSCLVTLWGLHRPHTLRVPPPHSSTAEWPTQAAAAAADGLAPDSVVVVFVWRAGCAEGV